MNICFHLFFFHFGFDYLFCFWELNLPTARIARKRHTRELFLELNLRICRLRGSLAKVTRASFSVTSTEAHATQSKLKLGASYDVHLPLFTIYAVEVGRKWRGWWIERDRRRRWPGAWTLVGEEPQLGNPNWACSKHEVCAGQILAKYTGGASPWRADACLGSAHARNYRGCIGKSRP